MIRLIQLLLLLLPLLSHAKTVKQCDWLPAERSAADIPVEVGYTVIPGNPSLVTVVVNYGTLMERLLPRNENDPRLHSHIWIMDKEQCKQILILPLPINASINVDAVRMDSNALPITQLPNGNLEFKYAFAIPEKLHTIIARRVILNKELKIQSTNDIAVELNGDARKAAFIADWHENGRIFHFSEPLSDINYHKNSLVYFGDTQINLHHFTSTHSEFQFMKDGIILDDTRAYNKNTYYPRYYLLTSFDPELKYFRQFTLPQIQKSSRQLNLLYFNETKQYSMIKISNMKFNVSGKIIEPKNMKDQILPDYTGEDKLKSSDITSYRWQNNLWVQDSQLQPKQVTAEDLKKINQVWP